MVNSLLSFSLGRNKPELRVIEINSLLSISVTPLNLVQSVKQMVNSPSPGLITESLIMITLMSAFIQVS